MELKDIKDIWSQYDKKLEDGLQVNEELLRKTNLKKTQKALKQPLYYEISSVIVCAFCILALGYMSILHIDDLKFSIPGLLSVMIFSKYLMMSWHKTRLMSTVEYYNAPTVEVQKSITNINMHILKYRKIEIYLMPFMVITCLPILFKALHNINLYENWILFVIELIVILGIALPLAYWINKNLFDKKLNSAKQFMDDIRKFEEEEG